jgi:hypothetical protein
MTEAMKTIRGGENLGPLDAAIAFEEYRLQIVARWPDSDTKHDMVFRIERTLQRLREERVQMKRIRPEVR